MPRIGTETTTLSECAKVAQIVYGAAQSPSIEPLIAFSQSLPKFVILLLRRIAFIELSFQFDDISPCADSIC